jgi:hypothetical protein
MIQFMMQSSKIGKKERIKSEHIKEQVSMENEVEKARMILDEDEAKPEEAEEPEGYLDEEEAEEPEGYLDEEEAEEPEGYPYEEKQFRCNQVFVLALPFQMMSQRISRSGIWI